MEVQVQELLDRIKSEGVEAAKLEASKIVAEAESKAQRILSDAEKNAKESEIAALKRVEALEKASRLALSQASRDTILALRSKIQDFMRAIVKSTAGETMNGPTLAKLLPTLLAEMGKEHSGDLSVLVPSKTLESIDESLAVRLSQELGRGIVLKPFDGIDAGFRVSAEGSSAHVDFSSEAVATILASRVNARLAEIVKSSIEGPGLS